MLSQGDYVELNDLKVIRFNVYNEMARNVFHAPYHEHVDVKIPNVVVDTITDYMISVLGMAPPPPAPYPGENRCQALFFAVPEGITYDLDSYGWHQCGDEPGHDGDHDNGDWCWADSDKNTVQADQAAEFIRRVYGK